MRTLCNNLLRKIACNCNVHTQQLVQIESAKVVVFLGGGAGGGTAPVPPLQGLQLSQQGAVLPESDEAC